MKARVGMTAKMTAKERKAMDDEIDRQLAEATRRQEGDIDALLLWYLHTEYGFGEKRLRKFMDGFNARLRELSDWYDMGERDQMFLVRRELKKIGIDIDEWR